MLLKRQEVDNVIKAMYNSSNILASVYNKETSDLTLIFNKGTQYKYSNVKSTDYTRFEIAESQGKVFNTHIKNYIFEKLEDINPTDIILEVKTIKEADDKALIEAKQLNIMDKMKMLITYAGNIPDMKLFTSKQLESLQESIEMYLTESIKN